MKLFTVPRISLSRCSLASVPDHVYLSLEEPSDAGSISSATLLISPLNLPAPIKYLCLNIACLSHQSNFRELSDNFNLFKE